MVERPSICALLGELAIGARLSLLWQRSAEREMSATACTRSMPSYFTALRSLRVKELWRLVSFSTRDWWLPFVGHSVVKQRCSLVSLFVCGIKTSFVSVVSVLFTVSLLRRLKLKLQKDRSPVSQPASIWTGRMDSSRFARMFRHCRKMRTRVPSRALKQVVKCCIDCV